MPATLENRTTFLAFAAAACGVAMAGAGGLALWSTHPPQDAQTRRPMLLAPMIGVIEPCILARGETSSADASGLVQSCTGAQGSAGALVESTLSMLQPRAQPPGPYALGYTLPVPLLQLFRADTRADANGWSIDPEMVARLARTVRDADRPVILYLFSTHFAADAPIEAELAQDSANIGHTRDGPLPQDTYYGAKIYNWSFASADNTLTQRRVQAARAVLEEVCKLEPRHIAKIRGVTLLGELHHLFPNFQSGMGFDTPYRVTDYSPTSVAGFRLFLQKEFGTVAQLNRVVGAEFKSFADVEPPARDIRKEPLAHFTQHIDSFAHGSLPVAGWAYVDRAPGSPSAWVHVYRDGVFAGKTRVDMGRQDVLQARPEFGFANTGWRLDLDFRQIPSGLHNIDVYLERKPGVLTHLGTRHIAVMERQRRPSEPAPQRPLPASLPMDASVQAYVDHPVEQSSYFFNPLVPLWHQFRAQQVVDYLRYFAQAVRPGCLEKTPRYTHQIIPFSNPGWDENKFAIQASLRPLPGLRLGVSLYDEPTYGHAFSDWYARSAHTRYGVTEFHPLKPMDTPSVEAMLRKHALQGADFLSFFAEPQWQGQRVARGHNMFSFDPANPRFGSDVLYESVRQVLATPTPALKETLPPGPAADPARP